MSKGSEYTIGQRLKCWGILRRVGLLEPREEGNVIYQNTGNYRPNDNTASHPRKSESSGVPT
jgi:hypothetical protein